MNWSGNRRYIKAGNVEESRDDQLWTYPIIVRSCCAVVTDSQRNFLYQIFARTDAQGHYRPETTFAGTLMKLG